MNGEWAIECVSVLVCFRHDFVADDRIILFVASDCKRSTAHTLKPSDTTGNFPRKSCSTNLIRNSLLLFIFHSIFYEPVLGVYVCKCIYATNVYWPIEYLCLGCAMFGFRLYVWHFLCLCLVRFWNIVPQGNSIFMPRFVIVSHLHGALAICRAERSSPFPHAKQRRMDVWRKWKRLTTEKQRRPQRRTQVTETQHRRTTICREKTTEKMRDHYRNAIWTIKLGIAFGVGAISCVCVCVSLLFCPETGNLSLYIFDRMKSIHLHTNQYIHNI